MPILSFTIREMLYNQISESPERLANYIVSQMHVRGGFDVTQPYKIEHNPKRHTYTVMQEVEEGRQTNEEDNLPRRDVHDLPGDSEDDLPV